MATNSGTLGVAADAPYIGAAQHPIAGAIVANPNDMAAYFPGTAGSVSAQYRQELNPSTPFSVECWVNKGAGSGYPLSPFSSLGTPLDSSREGWLLYDNTTSWQFRLGDAAGYLATAQGGTADQGVWYHLVGVYNGTHAILYVNGVQVSSVALAARPYVGNRTGPVQIGTCGNRLFTRNFSGSVDEAVIYTNALTTQEVLAHYQNGINPSPSQPYSQLVLAKQPVAYYRLSEPMYSPPDPSTLPVAVNTGSLGAQANGTYQPGSQTRAQAPPYIGFGSGNTGASLDGSWGYIGLGNPEGLNFTNQITVAAWVKPTATDGLRDIVAHGHITTPSCQELYFRINGGAYQFGSCASGEGVSVANAANQDVGRWVFLVGTFDGANWRLYRHGEQIGSAPGTAGAGLVDSLWSIGSRGDVSLGDGRYFAGGIDEVAIFSRALTQQEIRSIFYSSDTIPVIVQQPTAPTGTLLAGAPVTLTVGAVGTPTLYYQWTKTGVDITSQTNPSLSFPNITTNDSGNYTVVVSNTFGVVTSSVVALNVTYPSAPASLLRAVGYPVYNPATKQATLTQVILEFSSPLSASGSDPSRYTISSGTPLTVSSAQFANLNMTVILTTFAQIPGSVYSVTLTGVTDGVGNPLANNTGQFRAWTQSTANGVRFEYYPGEEGTTVANLLANMLYPDQPQQVATLDVFDSRAIFPNDLTNRYGARMSTFFTPPASGNYRFFVRSDDSARLYLNPAGVDPAGKVQIIDATACCLGWASYASAPLSLIGGQTYYLELLYQEGGGGDYGRVAVVPEGGSVPVDAALASIDPASMQGPAIGYPYAPTEIGGATVLVGPTSTTVQANHPVAFTVEASNPAGLPMTYQWLRNGATIAGATGSTYLFIAAPGDAGAQFSVRVSRFGSAIVSSMAILTVQSDTDVPSVAAVHGSLALNTFVVSFSQAMGTPSPSSYTVSGFTTTSAVLDSTRTNVVVTLDRALTPGQTYNVSIQNAADSSGTALASATVPLRAFFFSRGLMRFDFFGSLSDSLNDITQLTLDPRYPNSPDWTGYIAGFDSRSLFPDDSHAGYGAHVSGFFAPPTSDNYIFMIRSDDSSQLFMNVAGADPSPLTLALLAEQTGCCNLFDSNPPLGSMALPMTSGNLYYMEANLKEGGGGDYLQVATKTETDPTPPANLLPIPLRMVGYLADPVGAAVTITEQPANFQAVYNIAPLPATVLDANFSAGNGGFTVTNYGIPVGPWSYNAVSGSWTNFGQAGAGCGGPFASGLNAPGLTLTNDGAVMLKLVHRYSFEGGNWDLGQVRVSVNGGPFATVPAFNFQQNGYNGASVGTITPEIAATTGWINVGFLNDSPGYNDGTFITSTAYLGSYRPGDRIQIQLLVNWDDCSEGSEPNWEVKSVQVSLGGSLPMVATLNLSAESVYQNQPSPYLTYFWQKNTVDGYVDIPGALSSPTLTQNIAFEESGTQFRCIVYGLGAAATSAVSTVTVTVPITYTRPTPSTITLTWPLPPPPAPLTTFLLEQAPAITGTWTVVPSSSYSTTANTVSVTVTVQPGVNQFYRLRRQ